MTWLVPEPQRESTPNAYHPGDRRIRPVGLVVVHWTASPGRDYAGERRGADESRIRKWLRGERGESSTHLVVLRDGTVLQAAPLDARTWHAGKASWRGDTRVNEQSIGIDMENVGPLTQSGAGLRDSYGGPYRGPDVMLTRAGPHEPFIEPQMHALLSLVGPIVLAFPVLADPARWVGHVDVSPGRKTDPGPAFPWEQLRSAVTFAAERQSGV